MNFIVFSSSIDSFLANLRNNKYTGLTLFFLVILSIICLFVATSKWDIFTSLYILVFDIIYLGLGNIFIATFTYNIKIDFDKSNSNLTVIFNKLYINFRFQYQIEMKDVITLIPTQFSVIPRKKNYYHQIRIGAKFIYIAPMNLNGFDLINLLIEIFPDFKIHINQIPSGNFKSFIPKTRNFLNIPNYSNPSDYIEIEKLPQLLQSTSFEQLDPISKKSHRIKVTSTLSFIWIGLVFAVFLTIAHYMEISSSILILIFILESEIFYINILTTHNIFSVWFQPHEYEVNNRFVEVKYSLIWSSSLKISREMNPVLIIDSQILYLQIINDLGHIYYLHRIGRFLDS